MRCIVSPCPDDAQTGKPFCALHGRAPGWQRAAWMSVLKRKHARAPLATPAADAEVYDASNVAPKLWVGAKPPLDRSYPGVDMIVLCAAEYQPRSFPHFDGTLLGCPIPDDALSQSERTRALLAAKQVATALKAKRRVLVTCQQGKNRSAFVAALALGMITRATAAELVDLMRQKRHPTALYNPHFREYLETFVRTKAASS